MKHFFILVFLALLVACAKSLQVPMKSMEGASDEYEKFAKKKYAEGQKYYKLYCAGCHGIFGEGSPDAPNFSSTELHNYNSAFIRNDKENHAVAMGLDDETFDKIIFFLSNREGH